MVSDERDINMCMCKYVQYCPNMSNIVLACEVVKADGTTTRMYIAMVGVRGDWPWQRVLFACKFCRTLFATCCG